MNIFDMLDYGRIVRYDEERRIIITYNGHATYNAWREVDGHFENFDVRTVWPSGNRREATPEEARFEAGEWLSDMAGDEG